jgi:DNA modification methylase
MTVTIRHGDCREVIRTLPDKSVHCCVTSPPYFGLRDYGMSGQIGLEPTPDDFVAELVAVFREVRRVLSDDGTLWLNLGDSYAGSGRGGYAGGKSSLQGTTAGQDNSRVARGSQLAAGLHARQVTEGALGRAWVPPPIGLKQKDLIGIPWMVAFALRADGWYLRQDIIWSKPNPMPESVQDRCTKAHEYIFLLSKSRRYHYDADAIAEGLAEASVERLSQPTIAQQQGSRRVPGKTNGSMKAVAKRSKDGDEDSRNPGSRPHSLSEFEAKNGREYPKRNKRSVWEVTTQPFSEAHFATFPPVLIEPCIKAGCPAGGTVLDPFGGAGTTGMVADRLGRDAVLIELNPEYAAIAERRISGDAGMFADVSTLSQQER